MSFIWQNFSEDTTYKIATSFSPYMEVFGCDTKKFKDVNILIRFYNVFKSLIDERQIQQDNQNGDNLLALEGIENPILSFLADLDRIKGINLDYIVKTIILKEINSNYFGEEVNLLFNKLSEKDKAIILDYLLLKELSNDTNSYLDKVIITLFSDNDYQAIFYWHESQQRFILYSQFKENTYNLDKLKLIELLFMDIDNIIVPVWEYHFGIIDNNPTMIIGNIQII